MLRGGLEPDEVAQAVRRTGARIVHAHNLHPTLGWRALAAARAAGRAVVLHLHQYRLVCAIGVCFRDGHECLRCHGRNTLPGVVLNCRGSRAEAAAYGAGLMAWQRRLAAQADAFVVPSHFAESRLRALGAPLGPTFMVPHVIRAFAAPRQSPPGRSRARGLTAGPREGSRRGDRGLPARRPPLVVAGDGPERARWSAPTSAGRGFVGLVVDAGAGAAAPRRGARAVVPSLSAETFGLAAAEAMAAGLPVAASRIGALPELVPESGWRRPGMRRHWRDDHRAAERRRRRRRARALAPSARSRAPTSWRRRWRPSTSAPVQPGAT